jgi:hypothetical protein
MVDAPDLKSVDRMIVRVQVPLVLLNFSYNEKSILSPNDREAR